MSYQVIARKWRPQTFDEIVGQEHVTTTLKNALQTGRIGHAFLFTGIRGVGKTTAARVLAKALNCETGTTATPCNECSSCKEIKAGTSLDVKEIDGASNRGIDSIRELREGVAFAPARDRFKVYIVDEVHMLTGEAFNALLKTLEEPPGHVVFIFATTELHKVPRTIASRCQVFEFSRISVPDIVTTLEGVCSADGIEADVDALRVIAREADGSLRDASSLLDQVISFAGEKIGAEEVAQVMRSGNREAFGKALLALLTEDAAEAVRVFDGLVGGGLPARLFLRDLARYLSDAIRVGLLGADAVLETGFTRGEVDEMADLVRDHDTGYLATLLDLLVASADVAADSRCPELVAQSALVRAAGLKGLVSVESMITRLEAIKDSPGGAVERTPRQGGQAYGSQVREAPAGPAPPQAPRPVEAPRQPPLRPDPPKTKAIKRKPPEPAPEPAPEPVAPESPPPEADDPSVRDGASDGRMLDMFRKLPTVDKVLATFGGDVVEIRKEEK